jgi:ribosome biogenesis protein BMS1
VVDRHEDITNPNKVELDVECDRTIVFYGYVRGSHLKSTTKVHIIGLGDYDISDINALNDPCPIPDAALLEEASSSKTDDGLKKQVSSQRKVGNAISFFKAPTKFE